MVYSYFHSSVVVHLRQSSQLPLRHLLGIYLQPIAAKCQVYDSEFLDTRDYQRPTDGVLRRMVEDSDLTLIFML